MLNRVSWLRGAALRSGALVWCTLAAVALVAGALFLSTLLKGYLIAATVATLLSLLAAVAPAPRSNRWLATASLLLVAFAAVSFLHLNRIQKVESEWDAISVGMEERAMQSMLSALEESAKEARERATVALAATAGSGPASGFRVLDSHRSERPERSTIVHRGDMAWWSGVFRVEPDDLPNVSLGISFTPFFVVMHAAAGEESANSRALTVLDALPPADHLASSLERRVAKRSGTPGFSILPPTAMVAGAARHFVVAGDTLAVVQATPLLQGQTRLALVVRLTAWGTALLAVAAALFLGISWRRFRGPFSRAVALVPPLACVAAIPLNRLSNITRLFDPGVYYSEVAGTLTASAGAFLISAALVLLWLIALLRSPRQAGSKVVALLLVIVIAALGPFLLRNLARGISPSVWGSSTALWLSLEGALFFAACIVLLAGMSAGRVVLGEWRGLPALTAVVLAVGAAAVGPLVLEAPGRFPGWYPALWILAIASLALARPARGFYLIVATVAACGAATLVWGASVRQRVALAERELMSASSIDPVSSTLLERFGRALAAAPAPRDRLALFLQYVHSDLASAPYPLELFVWDESDELRSRLSLSRISSTPGQQLQYVTYARTSGLVVQQEVHFVPGAQMLIAAPHADGWVTTALVAPRSRIVRDEPFLSLFGLTQGVVGEPPYTLALPELPARSDSVTGRSDSVTGRADWQRAGDHLHGDIDLPFYGNSVRAHVEVDLRGYDALLERGTLVSLINLAAFIVLWSLAVSADGALFRWIRTRRRLWARSFRSRLSLALFGFFVIPAAVFALWSQRSILGSDRQARELLLSEMLRAAEGEVVARGLGPESARLDAPLFMYMEGKLTASSDSLFVQLAPLGLRLPPAVYNNLEIGEEMTASSLQPVGPSRALVGYRLVSGADRRSAVLAAPARADHLAIDRRRRDLGVLVLFTTAVGALAAWTLSGIAARQLARPIGILRGAAQAIARGEREPEIPTQPRSEFDAVFSAFRAMAGDLNASRGALVAAQKRTEAILRNVASGVIALDAKARVTLANPRSAALLGVRLETGSALDEPRLAPLTGYVRSFLNGNEDEREFDEEIGGRQMHCWITRLGGAGGGAVMTIDDVSELARAQRVIAWGQMARQVAHEIKNPLTPIRLGVQHLRRAHTDKRADFDHILDANVARILAEIDRLDEIARTFSRYGVAPSRGAEASPIDVGDVARDVVALERLGEGDVEWSYTESEGSLVALAAEDELREVILNLLENARHAGAKAVRVSVQRGPSIVRIDVRDDGHGITEEVLPRIFEPHFSTRSSGSGLGLAITRNLIEGWGGQIAVTSSSGKGTHITISLRAPREL